MPRIRIFVSFDSDHDADLRDRLREQSLHPAASFESSAHTSSGEMNDAWTARMRSRIRAADEVVVICGEYTDVSPHVAAELRMAQEEDKPYMLLWGRRERMCTKPAGARPNDAMYSWTPEILETQIGATLRAAQPPVVPESCKRP